MLRTSPQLLLLMRQTATFQQTLTVNESLRSAALCRVHVSCYSPPFPLGWRLPIRGTRQTGMRLGCSRLCGFTTSPSPFSTPISYTRCACDSPRVMGRCHRLPTTHLALSLQLQLVVNSLFAQRMRITCSTLPVQALSEDTVTPANRRVGAGARHRHAWSDQFVIAVS